MILLGPGESPDLTGFLQQQGPVSFLNEPPGRSQPGRSASGGSGQFPPISVKIIE